MTGFMSGGRRPLEVLTDEQTAILLESTIDRLIAKADDLPAIGEDDSSKKEEVEEVAALGRLACGLRRGWIFPTDGIARKLAAREVSETGHLDELREEYERVSAGKEAWAALLARFDTTP